jgi:hypothetical protein
LVAGELIRQARYDQALPLLRRGLAIQEKALWPEHPDMVETLESIGYIDLKQLRWDSAYSHLHRATSIRIATTKLSAGQVVAAPAGRAKPLRELERCATWSLRQSSVLK